MGEISKHDKDEPQLGQEPTDKKEGDFDLASFLVEPKTNYTELIEKAKKDWDVSMKYAGYSYGDGLSASNADAVIPYFLREPGHVSSDETESGRLKDKKAIDFLKSKIKGKILLDVGSGMSFKRGALLPEYWGGESSVQRLAKKMGASVCIGVDKYTDTCEKATGKPTDPSFDLTRGKKIGKGTQVVMVSADILDFLSRLPDNSVCMTINGIDNRVIENQEYHQALAKEMMRVLAKDGLIFGVNSDSLGFIKEEIEKGSDNSSIKQVKSPKTSFDALFLKKEKVNNKK